jgi:hypothetical protein
MPDCRTGHRAPRGSKTRIYGRSREFSTRLSRVEVSASACRSISDRRALAMVPCFTVRRACRSPAEGKARLCLHAAETARSFSPEGFFLNGDPRSPTRKATCESWENAGDDRARSGSQYPREVEDRLRAHPAVDDVCVIGIPHDILGELVCACAVPQKERSSLEASCRRSPATRWPVRFPDLVRFSMPSR